jgi:O-antigen/teichoic acid export membrane protein
MVEESSPASDTLTRALARGSGVNLVGFAVRGALLLIHGVLGTRLYGVEAYGLYAMGTAAVVLIASVGLIGLDRTVTRFVAVHRAREEPEHAARALKVAICLVTPASAAAGVALGVAAEPIADLFGDPRLGRSFRILALAVPLLALATVLAAFTQGHQQMRQKVVAMDIVAPAIEAAGLVVLGLLGMRGVGLSVAYVVSLAAAGILLAYYSWRCLQSAGADRQRISQPASALLKPMLRFALPAWCLSVLTAARRRTVVLMLGALAASAAAGIFGVIERLASLGSTFLVAVNMMLGPMVAWLVERRRLQDLTVLYKLSARWTLMVSLPVFLIMGFFAADVLQLYAPDVVSGAPALRYLVAASIFDVATGSCGMVLLMSGRPHYSAINEGAMFVVVAVLGGILVPRHGLLGAVWAVSAAIVMLNVIRLAQVWWLLGMHPFGRSVVKVGAAGLAMLGAVWLWHAVAGAWSAPVSSLLVGGALGLLGYTAVLIALGGEEAEKDVLRALRQRLSSRVVASR